MSECAVIPPLRQKSFCVRTQIAKSGFLAAEYILRYILTRTPSPCCAGWRWGLLSRKIFSDFIFFVSPIRFLLVFYFFIFSDFVIVLVWFWLSDYKLIISIFNLLILTRFGYAWLSSSTRLIFARYSLYVLRYILLASISTCFSIVYSIL